MKSKTLRTPIILLATLALLVTASAAMAGQGLYVDKNQRLLIRGTYSFSPEGFADCFQAQVMTEGDQECVRLQVVQRAETDLKMVLTCPDGSVWRDDDSGGALRPLIKAETSTKGWCTVQVCHYLGLGPSKANFALTYGRYDINHSNCARPTSPLVDDPFAPSLPETGEKE